MGVFAAMIPFLSFYLFWVVFFALMSSVLGANGSLASGYTGVTSVLGQFFNTFENSIGNINAPTIDFLKGKDQKATFLDKVVLYLIYFLWWSA